jgi:hypothetical protein
MRPTWLELILGILGVWRVTHLLHAEFGPWRLLERFREVVARAFRTQLFDCFYCLSVWVAVPFAVLMADTWWNRLFAALAFSAGAILLERATNPIFAAGAPVVPPHFEEPKPSHELLQSPHPDPNPGPGHS